MSLKAAVANEAFGKIEEALDIFEMLQKKLRPALNVTEKAIKGDALHVRLSQNLRDAIYLMDELCGALDEEDERK